MAETVIRCAVCGLEATICDQGAQGIGYFDICEREAVKCAKGAVIRCAGLHRAFTDYRDSASRGGSQLVDGGEVGKAERAGAFVA